MFSKLFAKVKTAVTKFTNQDAANCMIGGMALVGAADGDFDKKEFAKALEMASMNPALEGFDIEDMLVDWEAAIGKSHRVAKRDFMKLCNSVKTNGDDAELIGMSLFEIGEASEGSAEGEAAEDAFIRQACDALGVDYNKLK